MKKFHRSESTELLGSDRVRYLLDGRPIVLTINRNSNNETTKFTRTSSLEDLPPAKNRQLVYLRALWTILTVRHLEVSIKFSWIGEGRRWMPTIFRNFPSEGQTKSNKIKQKQSCDEQGRKESCQWISNEHIINEASQSRLKRNTEQPIRGGLYEFSFDLCDRSTVLASWTLANGMTTDGLLPENGYLFVGGWCRDSNRFCKRRLTRSL